MPRVVTEKLKTMSRERKEEMAIMTQKQNVELGTEGIEWDEMTNTSLPKNSFLKDGT